MTARRNRPELGTGNWELKNRDTHGRRVRLFKQSATGATTGLPDGQPKREKVWVPTDAFLPCMAHHSAQCCYRGPTL